MLCPRKGSGGSISPNHTTPGRKTFVLATAAWMIWCLGELAGIRGWLSLPTATHFAHLGILLVELGVGITVAAVMATIFFQFAGRGRTDD